MIRKACIRVESCWVPKFRVVMAITLLMCAGIIGVISLCSPPQVHAGEDLSRADFIHDVLLDANNTTVLVAAHRGHHAMAPENTLESITACIDAGIHIAEVDIRRTSDGVYVLMHDSDIKRTTTGRGLVDQLSLDDIKQVRVLDGLRPTQITVPTFVEAIEVARGNLVINIDLKGGDLREVVEIVRAHQATKICIFKSMWSDTKLEVLEWIKSQDDLMYMPIVKTLEESKEAEKLGVLIQEVILTPDSSKSLTSDEMVGLRNRGTRIWINSLWNGRLSSGLGDYQAIDNPEAIYPQLVSMGAGIIQTDIPDIVLSTLSPRTSLNSTSQDEESVAGLQLEGVGIVAD